MERPELPDGVTPHEERAILDALERYLKAGDTKPPAWALAGRAANLRQGALQIRHQAEGSSWRQATRLPFANRGTEPVMGRGDAK
ncbi:MAG: hypothetical protein LC722_06450 [Actinobacteria bacterium]|nr:hypothetical protein [Actinomycetota bacterium]